MLSKKKIPSFKVSTMTFQQALYAHFSHQRENDRTNKPDVTTSRYFVFLCLFPATLPVTSTTL